MFCFEICYGVPLHALDKGAKGFNLCPKEQVSKLSVGKEDNEEHDGESQDVFSTAAQCGGELSHGLVETDVFENLEYHQENKYKSVKLWPNNLARMMMPANTSP